MALKVGSSELTFDALDRAAGGVALALGRRGIGAGSRVAVVCGNDLAFPAAYYGALRSGAVVAPLSTASPPAELAALVRTLRAALVVTDPEHLDAVSAALRLSATGARAVVLVANGGGGRDRLALTSLVARQRSDPALLRPLTPAVILTTSGTTGLPKRTVHSHGGLGVNARAVAGEMLRLGPGDRQLCALPLAHSFGMSAVLNASMLAGCGVVIAPRFEVTEVNGLLDTERVTVLQGVPTMLARLAAARGVPAPGLRRVVVSGAPLPAGLAEQVHKRLCGDVVERYGMSECSPLTMRAVPRDGGEPGDVGRPLDGVVVRVAGGASEGELEAWSPAMFLRYDRDRTATAAAVVGGFLQTGDLGTVGPGGRVRLLGRAKDLILRGGNNIVPAEVERVLESHPAVAEVAVVGLPDDDLGERVAVAVVLRPRATPRDDRLVTELRALCAARLASYKVPQDWRVEETLPRTATGKVRRAELRALFDR